MASWGQSLTHWVLRYVTVNLTLKDISMTDTWIISCGTALTWMPQDLGENESTLVQVITNGLFACSAPSHHLNQFWIIVNWTLGNKSKLNWNENICILISLYLDSNFVQGNWFGHFICKKWYFWLYILSFFCLHMLPEAFHQYIYAIMELSVMRLTKYIASCLLDANSLKYQPQPGCPASDMPPISLSWSEPNWHTNYICCNKL